jgi:hypothetical protein
MNTVLLAMADSAFIRRTAIMTVKNPDKSENGEASGVSRSLVCITGSLCVCVQ